MTIEFTVPGNPVAQSRPRFTTKGGFPRAYDKQESRDYKASVAAVACWYAPKEPLQGALLLEMVVYREIPKSFSKKKRVEALGGTLRPITKPDADNYCKGVMDALNGLLWTDDAQVVTLVVTKLYSDEPRVEVKVSVL